MADHWQTWPCGLSSMEADDLSGGALSCRQTSFTRALEAESAGLATGRPMSKQPASGDDDCRVACNRRAAADRSTTQSLRAAVVLLPLGWLNGVSVESVSGFQRAEGPQLQRQLLTWVGQRAPQAAGHRGGHRPGVSGQSRPIASLPGCPESRSGSEPGRRDGHSTATPCHRQNRRASAGFTSLAL